MKRILSTIVLLSTIVFISSCYEDKGNYDYSLLSKPVITGIPDPCDTYAGSNLIIPVKIEWPDGEIQDVSYEWRVNNTVISNDKNLNYKVVLDVKPGQYADFSVIDNRTGLRTMVTFKLNVTTMFASGWMILSDAGDYSELSYIRNDGQLHANIYEEMNGEKLGAGAVQIKEHWLPWSEVNGEIFIGVPTGPNYAVDLDGNSFKRVVYSKDEFFEKAPDNFSPVNFDAVANWDYMISNGKLYTRHIERSHDANYHEGRFVRLPVSGNYELLPITFRGNLVFSNDIIAFDKLSKSYKLIRAGEVRDFNYTNDPNKKFRPSNMDKLLLAGAATSTNTPTDDFIAFLSGSDGEYYVQKFRFSGWGNKSYSSLDEKIFPEPQLIKPDTKWAICQGRTYAYFTSGNQLYVYNYGENANTVRELKGTAFNGTIKAICIDPRNYSQLAVAVQNAGNSSCCDFMLLDISVVGDGKLIEGSHKEAALGNVTSIAYKLGSQWNDSL